MLCLHAVTDEDGHPLENEDESGRRLCEHWGTIFEARIESERHHCHETMLRYVQKAPDDIRCAEGLASQFLFNACKHVIEGGPVPHAICCEQNCFYSQVLQCRPQWPHCEIAGRTTSVDTM